jgi:hypothetical protein
MALRSGLAGQVGLVGESTYGTPVVVTRFPRFVSESLKGEIARIESDSILAGRQVRDSSQWFSGAVSAGGDLAFELTDRGQGLLWTHMMGGAAISGSGTYTQTYTPGDLAGMSFTTQVGRPDMSGTVRAVTYTGCKVASWEVACAEGEIATLGLTVTARNEFEYRVVTDGVTNTDTTVTSATAMFSPFDVGIGITGTGVQASTTIASVQSATSVTLSQATTATATGVTLTFGQALATFADTSSVVPYRYTNATLTLGGSTVKVKSAKIAGDNKLEERRFLGQHTTDDPQGNDLREYTGELVAEFSSNALYDRFRAGTESALVLAFTVGATAKTCTITANVRYDGTTTAVAGRAMLEQTLPFVCVGTTDAAALTIVTVNTDAAA